MRAGARSEAHASWRSIGIDGVSKKFAEGPWVLKDINLTIERGSFQCILGPSGCGKSTLLDLLAGFEQPTEGRICYDAKPIGRPGPDRVVIFQDASNSLFPWLNVKENIEFGLNGLAKVERERRGLEVMNLVSLADHATKYPAQLSGGMKQRVQIARGLVMDPDVLLMDEPFGALDALTRENLQKELREIWRRTEKTIVFITHDVSEALMLATDIVILSAGPDSSIVDMIEDLPTSLSASVGTSLWMQLNRRIHVAIGQPGSLVERE